MIRRFPRLMFSLLAVLAAWPLATRAVSAEKNELAVIRELNGDYLRAYLACDVARYRELLADDFRGVLADGREVGKEEFLKHSAVPPPVKAFRPGEFTVRLYGETAVVNGRVAYTSKDGAETETRYVNVFVRRQERWQLVSAQSTRVGRSL